MLVHLGGGTSVPCADLIALTDLQTPVSADTAALLAAMRAQGAVIPLGPEPKTMVLCRDRRAKERCVCYLSCVGLRTLRRRIEADAHPPAAQALDIEVQHG